MSLYRNGIDQWSGIIEATEDMSKKQLKISTLKTDGKLTKEQHIRARARLQNSLAIYNAENNHQVKEVNKNMQNSLVEFLNYEVEHRKYDLGQMEQLRDHFSKLDL